MEKKFLRGQRLILNLMGEKSIVTFISYVGDVVCAVINESDKIEYVAFTHLQEWTDDEDEKDCE